MIQPDTRIEGDVLPLVVHAIDDMLRLTELVRHQHHRDPLRALEDVLLDMRSQVTATP